MEDKFYDKLIHIIEREQVLREEPMSRHTTFRIGGCADYFVVPKILQEVQALIRLCNSEQMPYYILGNGSNLLVGDRGYRGVIIQIYRGMSRVETAGTVMKAQAGALLSQIAKEAWKQGLTGLEFAAGIPGTLGGAVVMNAGAYGGEMKDVLKEVTVLTKDGEVLVLQNAELELGYRTSIAAKQNYMVLEAVLQLKSGSQEVILKTMETLREKRTTKQPLEYPSAGSTFKRPEGCFAGQLIEAAGMRGFCIGGAQVSEKHCGFVINKDNATASDVVTLMELVAERVKDTSGVVIEPEVKKLGEF